MDRFLKITILSATFFTLPLLYSCGQRPLTETAKAPVSTQTTPITPAVAPVETATTAPPTSNELKTTPAGLQYQDLNPGSGPKPFFGQTLFLAYTGWLKNGTKFESGSFEYKPGIDKLIKGWELGILGGTGIEPMRVGGKRKLIIPPELGYGAQVQSKIPANSTLIFEVELLKLIDRK